ncbi:hypothetical protein L195_g039549 [Trifolium pratense]|uniref:Uncharacterized protein n=1 Tax=Trifolium pratense TaxID=57577 RepID=A0A2K3LY96_TRIPR|nr:hypothetical protein L195_g039549 [Trifolium pratense]
MSKAKWDCGSTLYDSYELNSFKRQIDSAIANSPRTHSMPHLTERKLHLQFQPQPELHSSDVAINNKSTFKFSRTFQKLLRFVFKSGNNKSNNKISSSSCNSRSNSFRSYPKEEERLCVVYDKFESEPVLLSTIPELPDFEIAGVSPDISNFVRKTTSERFTANATIGISCA